MRSDLRGCLYCFFTKIHTLSEDEAFQKINVDHEPMWPSHSSSVLTGHRCRSCSPVRERSQLQSSSQNERGSILLQSWGNSLPLALLTTWHVGKDICYHQRKLKYRVITTS